MFFGWEGNLFCPTWYNIYNTLAPHPEGFLPLVSWVVLTGSPRLPSGDQSPANSKQSAGAPARNAGGATTPKLKSEKPVFDTGFNIGAKAPMSQRIGPHNIDVLSLIIGSLLGDSHLEKRKNGIGSRLVFEQSNKTVEYLMWFYKFLATRGYCSDTPPNLHKKITKGGQILFHYKLKTFTFTSFNCIHDMFYIWDDSLMTYKKVVPSNISDFLTPMALAPRAFGAGAPPPMGAGRFGLWTTAPNQGTPPESQLMALLWRKLKSYVIS